MRVQVSGHGSGVESPTGFGDSRFKRLLNYVVSGVEVFECMLFRVLGPGFEVLGWGLRV